ncbi:MAG: inositol monophosphatase family protein [Proteobacteria bacterium]|nr:inositol monophosphatase family protein [Pseudomonadota bacterium]
MTYNLSELSQVASEIAQNASAIPMQYFRTALDITDKADDSPVTIADQNTERFIRDALAQHYPDHDIFGEEFGISGDLSGASWIIDPIDGTRSFISGNPLFGMLMGFLDAGKPQIGLVRMPALDETFVGVAGIGATKNGAPIACRKTTKLAKAILYINEAENINADDPARFARLCKAGHTRRMAYDCYPHAMVAGGNIDAVVDCNLEPYDYLPLVALIEAAGGIITDWQGAPLTLQSDGRVVTAATPELHAEILALLGA